MDAFGAGRAEERSRQLREAGLRALLRHDLDAADMALVMLEREGMDRDYATLAEAFIREAAR